MKNHYPSYSLATLKAADGKRASKDETIYTHLNAAIISNLLEPGTKLPEDALAETYKVSRTSIRKALQRLAHEGLVDIRMNHGASVAQPTLKDARDLFASRQILECGAMAQVIEHITKDDIALLKQIASDELRAAENNDRSVSIFLSGRFHIELIRISKNEIITNFLSDLVARTSLVMAAFGAPGSCGCPPSRHKEIISLLSNKKSDEAEHWMRTHLQEIENSIITKPEQNQVPDLKSILDRVAQELSAPLSQESKETKK